MRRLSCVLLVVLVGCGGSLRDRADDAFNKRDYRQAAELYDRALAQKPNDPVLLARRTESRHGVLGLIFQANQVARRNGDRAMAIKHLGKLLEQRDAWEMQIDPRWANALAAEVGMAGNDIALDVDYKTNTVGPLAGEALLGTHAALLKRRDFGGRGEAIRMKVSETGRVTCTRIAFDANTPFWKWAVDRYCTHWGEPNKVGAVELTALRSSLSVTGGVTGESGGEATALEAVLADGFKASAWYAPTGAHGVTTALSGTVAIGFSSRAISQSTTYDEQVPYTDYETTQESYQEPYDDTESYSDQVPYSDTETRWESCPGNPTQQCSHTETVTKYRTEWKTRTVTKYRTAWRSVTNPVTKYRTVTHPFNYTATEVSGSYEAAMSIRVVETEGTELAGVGADIKVAYEQSGIDHDVTFQPAGVYPSRANLPSRADVLDEQHGQLRKRLIAALDERYAKTYCAAATYDREAAAACLYLDHAKAPRAVHATLAAIFGADEPFLGAVTRK